MLMQRKILLVYKLYDFNQFKKNTYYKIAILGQNISIVDYKEADNTHQCFLIYNDTDRTGNYQCLGILF